MSIAERIWNWLTAATRPRAKKGHPDLYPLDVEALAKELRLVEEARRLGQGGLPAADATAYSGPEAAIIQRVEKARQDYIDWATLRLNVINRDLSQPAIANNLGRAAQADQEFVRRASATLSERMGELGPLADTAAKRTEELDSFKITNRLTRDAEYPTSSKKFLRYALLLALIVVEALLNARFFATGLMAGLIGGFTQAGILAALNVIVAFGFGSVPIRYIFHSNVGIRILGIISLAVAVLVMTSIGLGIAHYRDALTAEMADPARSALDSLLQHPLQLRDFFSWALFLISVSFAVTALVDGISMDDLYPGYGKKSRRAQEAIEDHQAELDEVRSELEAIKEEELKALDEAVLKGQSSIAVFEGLVNDKRMTMSRLTTALRDADNSLDALLRKFRTENELHRNGVPRPAYFDHMPNLRPIELPSFDEQRDIASLAERRQASAYLLANVEHIRGRIQEAFNQQFDRLKPLDKHFPGAVGS